ncbi:MAG: hypothetical protein NWR42_01480, partial [Desulfobacterales bacterium]|nr:hypothetical protein [Desulfobacterales bacterium]
VFNRLNGLNRPNRPNRFNRLNGLNRPNRLNRLNGLNGLNRLNHPPGVKVPARRRQGFSTAAGPIGLKRRRVIRPAASRGH